MLISEAAQTRFLTASGGTLDWRALSNFLLMDLWHGQLRGIHIAIFPTIHFNLALAIFVLLHHNFVAINQPTFLYTSSSSPCLYQLHLLVHFLLEVTFGSFQELYLVKKKIRQHQEMQMRTPLKNGIPQVHSNGYLRMNPLPHIILQPCEI